MKAQMSDLQKRYEDGMKVLLGFEFIDLGQVILSRVRFTGGGGRNLGLGIQCDAGTLESLAYTRPRTVEFFYHTLDYCILKIHPYLIPHLNLQWSIDQFPGKGYPIIDPNSLISIGYPRLNCLKVIPFTASQTHIVHI